MNQHKYLKEILEEARALSIDELDEYFNINFRRRTAVYQLCKKCKHILLRHTLEEDKAVLNRCRANNDSCVCREFK